MHGISLKALLLGVVLTATLAFTGCGLQVRSITLVEAIEVPSKETLGDDADPEWIAYLAGQDYEINEALCDLDMLQETLAARLPNFIAERIVVRSARVVSLEFAAQEGNFASINEMSAVVSIDDDRYMFSSGYQSDGFGSNVRLRPRPRLNLADAINDPDISCVYTYMRIAGTLPEEELSFDVVLNFRLRLGFSLF